jgi:hypothetical protein
LNVDVRSTLVLASRATFASQRHLFGARYPHRKSYLDANRLTASCHLSPNTRIITC